MQEGSKAVKTSYLLRMNLACITREKRERSIKKGFASYETNPN
jgi:hypothetical protein